MSVNDSIGTDKTQRTLLNPVRLVLLLVLLFIAAAIVVIVHLANLTTGLAETTARENARRYSEALATVRSRYTSEVVARVEGQGVKASADYAQHDGEIPLPATLTHDLGKHIAETGSGARVQLYSDFPFPRREDRVLDEFQQNAIARLRENPREPVELVDWDEGVLRYATADLMQQSCVDCHNTDLDSPKTDWQVGDVRGVLEVTLPIDQVADEIRAGIRQTTVIMLVLGAMGLLGLGLVIKRTHRSSRDLERSNLETAAALREQQATNEQLNHRSTELSRMHDEAETQRLALSQANQDLEHRTAALTEAQELITEAVQHLSKMGRNIVAAANDQAGGAQLQATAISEIVATVAQLSQSADQAATLAKQVVQAAQRSQAAGQSGRHTIEAATEAMARVRAQVETVAESIMTLSDRAQAIENITNSVKNVADQTNVLALNAAVEASRAGEHGKGFAVVAAEVKALAEQSKQATTQVGRILAEIQDSTNTAVLSIEQGAKSVNQAAEIVAEADETIVTLVNALSHSSQTADRILASAHQQVAGAGQLKDGIQSINTVTEKNVVTTQQIVEAAEALRELSDQLSDLTD